MRVAITFGTFDLFHIGHVNLLRRARKYGDCLVVGVSTDAFSEQKKGYRPLFGQRERADIVAACRYVDEVFFEESFEAKGDYVRRYRADTLVMGDDWFGEFDDTAPHVVYLSRTPGVASSELRAKAGELFRGAR